MGAKEISQLAKPSPAPEDPRSILQSVFLCNTIVGEADVCLLPSHSILVVGVSLVRDPVSKDVDGVPEDEI